MHKNKRVLKHALILLTLTVFSYVSIIVVPLHPVEAAYSKVATTAAKKVIKEVVENNAVQMAMDIVFEYEMNDIMKNGYKVDSGYTAVCMEESNGKCTKPMQAKVPTTQTEKTTLKNKIEQVIERKTGTTGFGKILDWFVPIFLLGAAASWIEAQFDDDSKGLLDDIAKESLDETGFIKVLPLAEIIPDLDNSGNPISAPVQAEMDSEGYYLISSSHPTYVEMDYSNLLPTSKTVYFKGTLPFLNSLILIETVSDNPNFDIIHYSFLTSDGYSLSKNSLYGMMFLPTVHGSSFADGNPMNTQSSNPQDVLINGEVGDYKVYVPNQNKIKQLALTGYNTSSGYGLSAYVNTEGNNVATFKSAPRTVVKPNMNLTSFSMNLGTNVGYNAKIKISFYPSAVGLNIVPYKPNLKEYPTLTIDNSIFGTDDDKIMIPPPSLVPIQTPDGTPVKPDGNGGWVDYNNQPIIIDEDTLIVGDIVPTPEEDGYITPDGQVVPKPQPEPEPEPTPNPSENDIDQLGNNVPKELILALLDLLRSCLYFMVRLVVFITTLPFLSPIPIPNEALVWFFQVEILGIQVMNVVRTLALTGLSFGIYKLVKKVF